MWVTAQDVVYEVMPVPKHVEVSTGSRVREKAISLVKSNAFEIFIMVCILINTMVLACHWLNMSSTAVTVIYWLNMSFNFIFTIEAVVKIYALRCSYFKDGWNIYDFFIVASTYGFLILEVTGLLTGVGATTTILRALRVGRIVRLVRKATSIRIIIYTLVDTW